MHYRYKKVSFWCSKSCMVSFIQRFHCIYVRAGSPQSLLEWWPSVCVCVCVCVCNVLRRGMAGEYIKNCVCVCVCVCVCMCVCAMSTRVTMAGE